MLKETEIEETTEFLRIKSTAKMQEYILITDVSLNTYSISETSVIKMYSCILAVLFILRIVKRSHLFAPKYVESYRMFLSRFYHWWHFNWEWGGSPGPPGYA